MLNHPTIDKLKSMRLNGMATALIEQNQSSTADELSFEERLGLLVDYEWTSRENSRLKNRLKKAKLRHAATFEDIDFQHPRGLDRSVVSRLGSSQWIKSGDNLLIIGPTGIGKSWLACALAHKACFNGLTALYLRVPRLFQDLAVARGDGRFDKVLASLAKTDLLVLDDWGLNAFEPNHRRDLLEILEERHGRRSTIVTSQLPVDHWHEIIGEPTIADAILDRLVHNAHRINLNGESLRKTRPRA
ncbi:IS21-like element helper ATPase IstB [Magnetofaba australis]|uniref:Putative ISPsy14, transposition helper protein n=1 Tax=Magnetofaba australis IT-1 TaxID=1434232 RepID=A0A1Y2K4Z8_9PROT|nr:IS21-like element helper ATPase IstB [Magnetofaba australis]OSM04782.1 putative ISPsy14, transposition helper protein [Magnetofaba australis IT-1]